MVPPNSNATIHSTASADSALRNFVAEHKFYVELYIKCSFKSEYAKGTDVHAQYRMQVLILTKPSPQPAAVAEHHGEKTDASRALRLIFKADLERSEISLCLVTGRSLEANLEVPFRQRPHVSQIISQDGIAAVVAALANFTQKAHCGQLRKLIDSFEQIPLIGCQLARPGFALYAAWVIAIAVQVFAYRLAITSELAGDFTDAQPFENFNVCIIKYSPFVIMVMPCLDSIPKTQVYRAILLRLPFGPLAGERGLSTRKKFVKFI